MALMMGAGGVFALVNLNKIAANGEEMYTDIMASSNELRQIKENLLEISAEIQEIIYQKNPNRTKNAVTKIEQKQGKVNELVNSYKERELPQTLKLVWDSFLILEQQYLSERQTLIDYALAQDYEKTETIMRKVTDARLQMFAKINQLISDNDKIAAVRNNNNIESAKQTTVITSAIILGSFSFAILVGLILSFGISRAVKKGLVIADALGRGDLTVEVTTKSNDEVGKLIQAINQAKENIRNIIIGIMEQTKTIAASSEELSATLEDISGSFTVISENTNTINGNVVDIRHVTEELTSTIEQVESGVTQLANSSSESSSEAVEIQSRAVHIKKQGQESKQLADELYIEKQKNIKSAIEQGNVVEEIVNVANLINGIAEQTNLLALNAAIEAARAGEHGRGFGVVASEIGNLADQSTEHVKQITKVVQDVKDAFDKMAKNSKDVLEFVDGRVKLDYELLVQTGSLYEKDAAYVSEFSQDTASMAQELNASTEEISSVIQSVAATIGETTTNFEQIRDNIEQTTLGAKQISEMAQNQATVADSLTTLVASFKI